MSKNNRLNKFDRANNPIVEAFEAAFRPLVFNTKARNNADKATVDLAKTVVKDLTRDRKNAEIALKIQQQEVEQRQEALRRKAQQDAADAIQAQRQSWASEYGYILKDGEFVQA